jgi:hypothetical protein
LFSILWPLTIILLDEIVKRADMKRSQRLRKRRRIQFDTKLGMWSPR